MHYIANKSKNLTNLLASEPLSQRQEAQERKDRNPMGIKVSWVLQSPVESFNKPSQNDSISVYGRVWLPVIRASCFEELVYLIVHGNSQDTIRVPSLIAIDQSRPVHSIFILVVILTPLLTWGLLRFKDYVIYP